MDINCYGDKNDYSKRQWAEWLILLDITNALEFGYARYRIPKPGSELNVETAKQDMIGIEHRWNEEWRHRDKVNYNGVPHLTELPVLAQCYYHGELEKARQLPNQNF